MALRSVGSRIPSAPKSSLRFLPTEGGKNASHYQSDEHRRWRRTVLERGRFTCVKCGADGRGVRLFADHIVEIEDGGAALDIANGACLCAACHAAKTALSKKNRLK